MFAQRRRRGEGGCVICVGSKVMYDNYVTIILPERRPGRACRRRSQVPVAAGVSLFRRKCRMWPNAFTIVPAVTCDFEIGSQLEWALAGLLFSVVLPGLVLPRFI